MGISGINVNSNLAFRNQNAAQVGQQQAQYVNYPPYNPEPQGKKSGSKAGTLMGLVALGSLTYALVTRAKLKNLTQMHEKAKKLIFQHGREANALSKQLKAAETLIQGNNAAIDKLKEQVTNLTDDLAKATQPALKKLWGKITGIFSKKV